MVILNRVHFLKAAAATVKGIPLIIEQSVH